MGKIADWFYVRKQSMRFKGKGEPDLKVIAKKYSNREEWESRRATIKKGILKGGNLVPLPKRTPLNPVIHSTRKYNGYKVENFYFESIPGFFVTGSLYQPLEEQDSMPLLLKPHGHKKNKRYTEDNQQICASFARMGVKVLTYDMIGYSCSTQVEHRIENAWTLQTWNSMRALDFGLSLPNVDPERVGCTGGSGGGTQTFMLTALDDRIRISAPTVMVSAFFFGGCVCESGLPVHKGLDYKTNNAEIAAMAAPRPQLITSVGGDWTRRVPDDEYPFIKRIYSFYGAEDKVENAHFPEQTHNYGPSKRQAAYDFFSRNFDLDITPMLDPHGDVDEAPNVIEGADKLKVFNEEHPRPDGALQSEEDIMKELRRLQSENKDA